MSTKTLRKRIALATVVALGAGVLSLVSTTSASAALNVAASTTAVNPSAQAGTLNIASNVDSTTTATASTTLSSNHSIGLLSVSDIAGGLGSGTTQTATLLSNGAIVVYTSITSTVVDAATNVAAFSVTGGTLSGLVQGGTTVGTDYFKAYGSGLNTAAATGPLYAGSGLTAVVVTPNAGATSMTISLYNGKGASSTTSPWGAATGQATATAAAAAPATGTLVGQIVVTISATSTAGTASVTKSGLYYADGVSADRAITADDTTNLTTPGLSNYATPQYAAVRVRDAYSTSITSGFLSASATGGYVAFSTGGSAATTSATTASAYWNSTTEVDKVFLTAVPTSSVGGVVNVTVSFNGTVIGTKSFTFTGKVAKVVLSGSHTGKLSGSTITDKSNGNYVTVAYYDAAGNAVYPSSGSTAYPDATFKDANISGTGIAYKSVTNPTSTSAGIAWFTCGTVATTGQLAVDYTNADGTVVVSNALPIACAGSAYSYSIKLDKSKYAPGDIATVTVTFKDSSGNLASDETATATAGRGIADGTNAPTVSPGSTVWTAITGPSKTDVTQMGVIAYKYSVGTTTGTYNAVVDFPWVDTNMGGAAQSATFTIADGSTSLNDVLKGIVSLIASINKQIAALAKLVTKK
jgi:trimeric autotransporter adhesin